MSLATSYAKALYQSAQESGTGAEGMIQLEKQLDSFVQGLDGSSDATKALFGPVMAAKDKIGLISAVGEKAGYTKLVTQFLILLVNKGRLSFVHSIRDAFVEVRLAAEGGIAGHLVSAEAISDADVKTLASAFGRKLGKRVEFSVTTDASLLAGTKVTVNGVTYDGTLRSQLQQLRDRLVAGAPAS
jgi:F-type H+-transporting ATPase subunit delta